MPALHAKEKFGLKIITYYQPDVTRFDDFRIQLEAGLSFDLVAGLALRPLSAGDTIAILSAGWRAQICS
ncbi:MAG: hypothetical protein J4G05_10345 [Chlorobi bacterium]|nr:hypothetical protein [Chlorobiota bacterium]